MHVLVTGSSGLIGTALVDALHLAGHAVRRAVRGETWDIPARRFDHDALAGIDAVVHLAGEGVGAKRWSAAQKERIRSSRADGTALLASAMASVEPRPRVLVSGSAVGYYGDRGDEVLTEESASGTDFLSEVCRGWEAATAPASEAGVRVVHLRTGIVLSARGGALRKQLPLFRMGMGGRLGSGRQWTSWVSLQDEVGAILHALRSDDLSGPINACAPNPATNAEFTVALGRALRRPARLPVPMAGLSLVLGREMAASLTASQRALPARLTAHGYRFKHPELPAALEAALRDN